MSARPPTERWPARPQGFYEDWRTFCTQALSERLGGRDGRDDVAAVLLAAGAVLGGAGMLKLVSANKGVIDAKGNEWGIKNLATIALVGGGFVGAAVGGVGGALLTRTLGRYASDERVDALQDVLASARREFEALRVDRARGRLDGNQHRLGVERLLRRLAEPG